MQWLHDVKNEVKNKSIGLSVFGMGYVGLPLLIESCKNSNIKGYGIEIGKNKLEMLKKNRSYIDDISDEQVREAKENGVVFTDDPRIGIRGSEISIICVPTPVNKHGIPKLDYIYQVADSIGINMKEFGKKQIIILESTTYPTTTDVEIKNILESYGLELHHDFELGYSPERIDPGNSQYRVNNIPKVLGTTSRETTEIIKLFYESIVGTRIVEATSTRVAEFTKLFENIFRQVNIALVNEMAQLAEKMQIDMFEVIELAATKPFGYLTHYPGPGLGGHCIPVDPYYLSHIAKKYHFQTKFIDLASNINEGMGAHTFHLITIALNRVRKTVNGSKISIFGYTYKPDIGDFRNSPAIPIADILVRNGANLKIVDKFVNPKDMPYEQISDQEAISSSDLIVIITPHSYINWDELIENLDEGIPLVDTRGKYQISRYRKFDISLGRPISEFNT